MPRMLLALIVLIAAVAPACGSPAVGGDCSGGRLEGSSCVDTQPAVHWTDEMATASARRFDFAPMVAGRVAGARCRIVARFQANDARAVCTGMFLAPAGQPRRLRFALRLSGVGAVNPDCSALWRTSPFCAGQGRTATSGGD